MQALLEFLMRNIARFWPIARVYEWDHGIMVRNGRIHRTLNPGLHWRWLFIEEPRTWPKTELVVALTTGSISTADGVAIAVSGNMGWRLVNMALAWREVNHLTDNMRLAAIGELCDVVAKHEWDALVGDGRAVVASDILAAINHRAHAWGVEATRIHLTDLVQARQHRHFIDGTLSR